MNKEYKTINEYIKETKKIISLSEISLKNKDKSLKVYDGSVVIEKMHQEQQLKMLNDIKKMINNKALTRVYKYDNLTEVQQFVKEITGE